MLDFIGVYRVLAVIDGDGFIGAHTISNEVLEFRLYGIDAPEIKVCKKLRQDEKELHIPGELLIQLGTISATFLRSVLPVNTLLTLKQERQNKADKYGRMLCYAFVQDGSSINEILVSEGYAKPYTNIYCSELSKFQLLNILAKQNGKGLYNLVPAF